MTRKLEINNIDLSHYKYRLEVSVTLVKRGMMRDHMVTTESFKCRESDIGNLLETVVNATLGGVLDILNNMPPSIRPIQAQAFTVSGTPWVSVLVEVDGSRPKIRFGMARIVNTNSLPEDVALAAASATLIAIDKDIYPYLNIPTEILDFGKKQRIRRWWKKVVEKDACSLTY